MCDNVTLRVWRFSGIGAFASGVPADSLAKRTAGVQPVA